MNTPDSAANLFPYMKYDYSKLSDNVYSAWLNFVVNMKLWLRRQNDTKICQ